MRYLWWIRVYVPIWFGWKGEKIECLVKVIEIGGLGLSEERVGEMMDSGLGGKRLDKSIPSKQTISFAVGKLWVFWASSLSRPYSFVLQDEDWRVSR